MLFLLLLKMMIITIIATIIISDGSTSIMMMMIGQSVSQPDSQQFAIVALVNCDRSFSIDLNVCEIKWLYIWEKWRNKGKKVLRLGFSILWTSGGVWDCEMENKSIMMIEAILSFYFIHSSTILRKDYPALCMFP